MLYVNLKTDMVIENGEGIIGYQYLHGTNASVGGFNIKGWIRKDFLGNITFDMIYTWNDIIDPNFAYATDRVKSYIASFIPGARPKNYVIRISWTDKSTFKFILRKIWGSGWLACQSGDGSMIDRECWYINKKSAHRQASYITFVNHRTVP